jgi:hypothetical protein
VGTAQVDPTTEIFLDHQRLRDADFAGRELTYFGAHGSRLERCHFEQVRIESGSFGAGREMSHYTDCSFDGARIWFVPGGCARFVRCSFRDVELYDWFCFAVEMIDCTFSGLIRKSVFNGSPLEDERKFLKRARNEFHGNDFSAVALEDVSFRTGIDLTLQKLPDGPDYVYIPDGAEAVRRAREGVERWTDAELRRDALVLVQVFEEQVSDGQRQLFIRPADFYPVGGREAVDGLVALIDVSAR